MDALVDVVALLSLTGIVGVAVGQGLIGVGLPFLLAVGFVENGLRRPRVQPHPADARSPRGDDAARARTTA